MCTCFVHSFCLRYKTAGCCSLAGVVGQALDALQPVLEALYHPGGIGHTSLGGCVAALLAAAHNPNGAEDLSIGAVYLFQARVSSVYTGEGLLAPQASLGSAVVVVDKRPSPHPHPPCLQTVARRVAEAVAAGMGEGELLRAGTPTPSPRRLATLASVDSQSHAAISAATAGLAAEPSAGSVGGAGGGPPGEDGGSAAEQREAREAAALAAWQLVLVPLAAAARQDARPKVADTAAATLFQVRGQARRTGAVA